MFVDERAIIVQLRWVLWSQRARSRSTRYLLAADLSIILKFIVLRVEARGGAWRSVEMVLLVFSQPLILL